MATLVEGAGSCHVDGRWGRINTVGVADHDNTVEKVVLEESEKRREKPGLLVSPFLLLCQTW